MTDKKYNKAYFTSVSTKDNKAILPYYKFIADTGISLEGMTICDIGCAEGAFFEALISQNTCFGVDVSSYAIRVCKKKFPDFSSQFVCCNINETIPPISNIKFDVITLFDVVEHLINFTYIQKFIDSQLKEDGYIILTTPNANSILRYLRRTYSGEQDITHTMLFTPYTLDFWLRRMGLKRVTISTPYSFYFHDNFLTKKILYGGQIFAIYKK